MLDNCNTTIGARIIIKNDAVLTSFEIIVVNAEKVDCMPFLDIFYCAVLLVFVLFKKKLLKTFFFECFQIQLLGV